jgi:hypothetical protein
MQGSVRVLLLLTIISACPPSVVAHHSLSAEFDLEKHMTVTGVLTQVVWMNPHVLIHVDVKRASSGKVETWSLQLPSPNILSRLGWQREPFTRGAVVTVNGYPSKDGSKRGSAKEVLSSGRKLFADL